MKSNNKINKPDLKDVPNSRRSFIKKSTTLASLTTAAPFLGFSELLTAKEPSIAGSLSIFAAQQGALAGIQGKCHILPGIEIGIGSRKASLDETYAATLAVFNAGARGASCHGSTHN